MERKEYMQLFASIILTLALVLTIYPSSKTSNAWAAPIPNYYGVYLVSDGKLIELKAIEPKKKANQIVLTEVPKIDVKDSKAYLVVFKQGVNPAGLGLTKLRFLTSEDVEFLG